MNKILVKVHVPTIEQEYDIWLPINKKLYKIIHLLEKAINELSGGYYVVTKNPCLYDKSSAKIFDLNLNAKENGIKNGMSIILI